MVCGMTALQTTPDLDGPTASQFAAYRAMFRHFNRTLFGDTLPEPLLNLSRGPQKAVAFFAPKRWKHGTPEGTRTTHEISLNPRYLADGSARETAQDLVHEMCHLWQHEFGTPSRPGYHDREWSKKMLSVGLQPIDASTGKPAMSAHGMSDEVIPDGPFARAFEELPPEALLPWSCLEARRGTKQGPATAEPNGAAPAGEERPEPAKPRSKVKYSCASCGANAWGKPGLMLACINQHDPVLLQPAA